MEAAEKDNTVYDLTEEIQAANPEEDANAYARLLLRRGRKFAYSRKFDDAASDFERALAAVEKEGGNDDAAETFGEDYPRLLEWVGICRHLRYDLSGALECYDRCGNLEPTNVEILVRKAGVQMDDSKAAEAAELFDAALGLDPTSRDALLHRSNLHLLKTDVDAAKKDLEKCIDLYPNFLLARLRLATVLMQGNNIAEARTCLDGAAAISMNSSDVHSYLGELKFAEGDLPGARVEFDRAIEIDPTNPTPYVNSALAAMNTPGPTGLPDLPEAISLLEKALEKDPQFLTAYLHLGQLRLSISKSLDEAREVVGLYDRGLGECRSKEELKDLCSMKVLAVAQIEAATQLKMETFSM